MGLCVNDVNVDFFLTKKKVVEYRVSSFCSKKRSQDSVVARSKLSTL